MTISLRSCPWLLSNGFISVHDFHDHCAPFILFVLPINTIHLLILLNRKNKIWYGHLSIFNYTVEFRIYNGMMRRVMNSNHTKIPNFYQNWLKTDPSYQTSELTMSNMSKRKQKCNNVTQPCGWFKHNYLVFLRIIKFCNSISSSCKFPRNKRTKNWNYIQEIMKRNWHILVFPPTQKVKMLQNAKQGEHCI